MITSAPFSVQDIVFGNPRYSDLVNNLIIATKKHIYFRKLQEMKPNFKDWIQYIKSIKETELIVACINMQREKFNGRWDKLLAF